MSAKALKYAEDTLGVHVVFEEVVEEIDSLDKLFGDLDKAQDSKREINEQIADREVELVHEMRSVHPNMSDTRFKSEWKGWERKDPELRRLHVELNKIVSEIQGLEYDADIKKLKIRAGSARLEELGGYLHYLAAVKNQAEKTTKTTETSDK